MKNFIKARIVPLLGIVAFVTVIGFGLAACSGGGLSSSDNSPFVGYWSGTRWDTASIPVNLTFKEDGNFTMNQYVMSSSELSGSYTCLANTAFLEGDEDGTNFAATATVYGDSLSITVNLRYDNGMTYGYSASLKRISSYGGGGTGGGGGSGGGGGGGSTPVPPIDTAPDIPVEP